MLHEYILPYIRIYRVYMHIWSLENIYIGHIYIFDIFFDCICELCVLHICKWVQIGANACSFAHHFHYGYTVF